MKVDCKSFIKNIRQSTCTMYSYILNWKNPVPTGKGAACLLWYLGDRILLWNLKKFDEKSHFHNNDIEFLDHHNYINWLCSPAGLSIDHLLATGHGSSISWDSFGYLEIRLVILRLGYLESRLVIFRLAWLETLNLLHSILHCPY